MLGVLSAPLRAEDSDGWHFTSALDVLTVGNAGKHVLSAAKRDCALQIAAGAASCTGSSKAAGAFGARLGTYYQSGGFYVGPSVGFFSGGPTAGQESLTVIPSGTLTRKTTNNTGRLLIEFGAKRALNDYWAFGLGAGLGAALVVEKNTCSETGALTGTCAASGGKSSVKKGWATWELTPSVQYRFLEFGVRFVGFARKKYAPWNTFGVFLGGRF